jgi:DNA (cytosine-5)-methyltransferase 1
MSESPPGSRPGFYEFFCGGGMARAGLGAAWTCLYAGDIDAGKGASYAANWGADALHVGAVADLRAADLEGRADLAWASFPCQDLSLAGAGAGLDGRRSSAFWGFHAIMRDLRAENRAPRVIALENVLGAVTSKGGGDFIAICGALRDIGYRVGALILDAASFLPQSRPRVFFIALDRAISPSPDLVSPTAPARHTTPALRRAVSLLPSQVAVDWLWWRVPEPPRANLSLIDIVDPEPTDVAWHGRQQTLDLLAALSPASRRGVAAARASGQREVGALFRRTRPDGAGGVRVQAEARFDGLAGCLRTPGGGSSRQFLIDIEGETARTRLIGPREAARLMGLPDSYRLPKRASAAFHLVGDGVAVPVVRFLSEALLLPLVAQDEAAEAPALRARRA